LTVYSFIIYTVNIGYSALLIKKRCAEAPTPKNINDESIMSAKPRSNNGDEQTQTPTGDDKINIAIPRRLINFITHASTQISVYVMISAFSPVLPSAQPKQLSSCPPPPPSQVTPKSTP
jgi:hypothetical protein